MRIKQRLAAYLAAAVGLLACAGCSRTPTLANEITFSLAGVSEITISYDEESVTFYENQRDELTVKEYMTEYQRGYCARTSQSGGGIRVSEGGKPLFSGGFSRRVEVYLPSSYRGDLTVTTTDGDIALSGLQLSVDALRVDSTAGAVRLGAAAADSIYLSTTSGSLSADRLNAAAIRIDTTSGSFSCERLEGAVAFTTTSGNAEVASAVGSGSYRASNSGQLQVVYTEVTGDLTFQNKNGGVHVTLPPDLAFDFEAATKNGSISTTFQECLSAQDKTLRGTVGSHPAVTVKAETTNGSIEVTR